MERCKNCGKELKDEVSKKRKYGPECWNKQMDKPSVTMEVLLLTGYAADDKELFSRVKSNLVASINLSDLGLMDSKGFLRISELETQEALVEQNIETTLYHEHHFSGFDVVIWVRDSAVPARALPEVPPDMLGVPEAEDWKKKNWEPVMHFHSQRMEMMALSPSKWELKDGKRSLVSELQYASGTLYVDKEDVEEEPCFMVDTAELKKWKSGDSRMFWNKFPEMGYLREMLQNNNIIIKSSIQVESIIGPHPEESDGGMNFLSDWEHNETLWYIQMECERAEEYEPPGDQTFSEWKSAEQRRSREGHSDWECWGPWTDLREGDIDQRVYYLQQNRDYWNESWMERLLWTGIELTPEGDFPRWCHSYSTLLEAYLKEHKRHPPLAERVKMHYWVENQELLDNWFTSVCTRSTEIMHEMDSPWHDCDLSMIFGLDSEKEGKMNQGIETLMEAILRVPAELIWKTKNEIFPHHMMQDN